MRFLIILILFFNLYASVSAENFLIGDGEFPVTVKAAGKTSIDGTLDEERSITASGVELKLKKGGNIRINTKQNYIESAELAEDAVISSGENKLTAIADSRVFFYYRRHYKTKKISHLIKGLNFLSNRKIKIFGKTLVCKAGVSEQFADLSFDSKMFPLSLTLAEDFRTKISGTDFIFRENSRLELFESVNRTENFIRSGNLRNPVSVKVGGNLITVRAADQVKNKITDVTFNRKGNVTAARVADSRDLEVGDRMYKYQDSSTIFFNDDGTVKCADWLIPSHYVIADQTILVEPKAGFCFSKEGDVISFETHNSYDPWTLDYCEQKIKIKGSSRFTMYDSEKIKTIRPDERGAEIVTSDKKTGVSGGMTIYFDREGKITEVK